MSKKESYCNTKIFTETGDPDFQQFLLKQIEKRSGNWIH